MKFVEKQIKTYKIKKKDKAYFKQSCPIFPYRPYISARFNNNKNFSKYINIQ